MKDTLHRHQAENVPGILLEHSWQESKKKKLALTEGGGDGKGWLERKGRLTEGLELGSDCMGR